MPMKQSKALIDLVATVTITQKSVTTTTTATFTTLNTAASKITVADQALMTLGTFIAEKSTQHTHTHSDLDGSL